MAQSEKPVIQWNKIRNISTTLTCAYVVGGVIGSKLAGQPIQWMDIMSETVEFFGMCYSLGLSWNFIYNHIQNAKAKRAQKYQENQNVR